MEDSTNLLNMEFESVHEQPAKIKVIGVGGGGGNAVNHMYRQGIRGVNFIVCNTDAKALDASPVPNKIELGKLGAGNIPERARKLALEHKDEIREAISNDTQMLFITAGMGGGTGTGAAPVIAEIAKSIELEDEMVPHILVVAIVTMPFTFEGKRRREQAEAGIEELKKYVDAILVINNDKLRDLEGNLPINKAFAQADDVLLTAAKGIAEIITASAYVNIDFRDVNTVMENSGTALMGAGEGRGENRAHEAIEMATTSVLLNDNDIRGSKNILLYISYPPDKQITMDEIGEVTDYLTDLIGNTEANIIWGAGDDDSLSDELRITLIATGFEQKPGPRKIKLRTDEVKTHETLSTPIHEEIASTTASQLNESAQSLQSGLSMPANTDPFSSPQDNAGNSTKRVFVLEQTEVDELEECEAEVAEEAPHAEANMKTGNSYLDEIRIQTVHTTSQPTPRAFDNPATTVHMSDGQSNLAVASTALPPVDNNTESIIQQQVEEAFMPSSSDEDLRVRQKADRIRRINELLHNNANGPKMVEDMNIESLREIPDYEANHSADEAHRTVMSADGTITQGFSFLKDLPD